MLTLAIESSCDDTAAAVLDSERMKVLSNIISSQNEIHATFGGIVPELASRRHIEMIGPVVDSALKTAGVTLDDIELIAVTRGPGLVGSLLVGLTYAKSISMVRSLPCVGVDHMAGHILSCMLEEEKPEYPYTALTVSGGNTTLFQVNSAVDYTRMGRTRDDAAGEAFDKVAKMLDLGYPGGPVVSKEAETGNPAAIAFPRSRLGGDNFDFSFSGLKTSVMNYINTRRQKGESVNVADICASFQEAVVDILVEKTVAAALHNNHSQVALGGGVASNRRLREQMKKACFDNDLKLYTPRPIYCTDNGAMVGLAGILHYRQNKGLLTPDADAYSRSPLS